MLRHGRDEADSASEARDFKGLWVSSGGEADGQLSASSLPDIRALTSRPSPQEPCRKQPPRPSDNRRLQYEAHELSACTWPAQNKGY